MHCYRKVISAVGGTDGTVITLLIIFSIRVCPEYHSDLLPLISFHFMLTSCFLTISIDLYLLNVVGHPSKMLVPVITYVITINPCSLTILSFFFSLLNSIRRKRQYVMLQMNRKLETPSINVT